MLTPLNAAAKSTATAVTNAAEKAAAKPGLVTRAEQGALHWLHDEMVRHTWVNEAVGNFTGPYIKHKFNAPAVAGALGPAPLKAETIAAARQKMIEAFKPQQGKAVIAIAGGGDTAVHAFVVSDVTKDGHVKITQAIAQVNGKPDDYRGIGGFIRWVLDKFVFKNPMQQMKGVVVEDWDEYAVRSQRNSVVVMEVDADPAKLQATLKKLQGLVGKPYDRTMTASDPATKSSEMAMYCTEISAWFVNELHPGTIKQSTVAGMPVFQVPDHLAATDVHGGALKVLYNGENRLDIVHNDPHPHQETPDA